MVALLSKDNVKFLTVMIDCLYMLAYRHQGRKVRVLLLIAVSGSQLACMHVFTIVENIFIGWSSSVSEGDAFLHL